MGRRTGLGISRAVQDEQFATCSDAPPAAATTIRDHSRPADPVQHAFAV